MYILVKSFYLLFLSGFLKFIFSRKNIIVNLLRLEVIGFSILLIYLVNGFKDFFLFSLVYICIMVSCSCMGLCLLIVVRIINNKSFSKNLKKVIC